MMIINKQDEVSTDEKMFSFILSRWKWRLWEIMEILIGNDNSICLTCHATSGICVRFWRVISSIRMALKFVHNSHDDVTSPVVIIVLPSHMQPGPPPPPLSLSSLRQQQEHPQCPHVINICSIDYYQNTDVWTFPNNCQNEIM